MNSKRTARNQQITDLVFASIIIAIILIMTFIPGFGFFYYGLVKITIIHIPVLVGTIVLGKRYGILFGTIFGLGSMIVSFIYQAENLPFTNPLLSVLPRIFFGYIIVILYDLFKKMFKNKYVSIPLTMGFASFIHTLVVLPILYIFIKTNFYFLSNEFTFNLNQSLFGLFWAVLTSNAIIEIILAVVVGSAVSIPILIIKEKFQ